VPEETEVETTELQEAIDEIHKERGEREEEQRATAWTRYISLTTALLAVFAAVGALQSGSLVNEAMISQLKASDTWNEYQSARQKTHIYTLSTNSILDSEPNGAPLTPTKKTGRWTAKSPADRAKEYEGQIKKEEDKSKDLSVKAKRLEKEAGILMGSHERFATSVAFIQVAIALGAISALTKIKAVWLMSILIGIAGIAAFAAGFLGKS